MGISILNQTYELGAKKLSVPELTKNFNLTSDKYDDLSNKIGTRFVYENSENENFASLAIKSIKNILEGHVVDQNKLGLILITQSNSNILPAEGQRIRSSCGLSESVFVIDINMGCSGYVYGLAVANSLIESGFLKNVILVVGDTYRKNINANDRSTFMLFSDAVSATLLKSKKDSQILGFDFGGDGVNFKDISLELPDYKNYVSPPNFHMNGRKVFQFTQSNIPLSINRVLTRNDVKVEDLKLVIFHQASKIVLDTLNEKVKISGSQTSETLSKFGNTGSASIPITLSEYLKVSSLISGDLILLSGFGVGLSYGTVLIKW
jgi:3-oxoacyl-[acyl-carrier-protein] synthase-3